MQVQEIGDPVRDRCRAADDGPRPAKHLFLHPKILILPVHDADKNADASLESQLLATPERFPRVPCILNGFLRGWQKQPFLRIDGLGVAWREIKEERIELVHSIHEPTPFG